MSNIQHPPVGFHNEGGNPPAQQLFESMVDYIIRYPGDGSNYQGFTQPVSLPCEVMHENNEDVLLFRVLAIPTSAVDDDPREKTPLHPISVYELQYAVLPDGFGPESDQPYPWVSYVLALMDHRPGNETDEPYSVLSGANGKELTNREIDEVGIVLEGIHKNMLEVYFETHGLEHAPRVEPTLQEFDEQHYPVDVLLFNKMGSSVLN